MEGPGQAGGDEPDFVARECAQRLQSRSACRRKRCPPTATTATIRSRRCAPRSIMVEDVGSMPTVGLLYASVEGFVNLPFVGRRLQPREAPAAPPQLRPGDAVTPA